MEGHQAWLVEGPWESLEGDGIAQEGGGGGGQEEQEQQQDIELGSMLAAAHFHIHRLFIGHPRPSQDRGAILPYPDNQVSRRKI